MAVCENRNGKFYITITEDFIGKPAILVDVSGDSLLKFGEFELVSKIAEKLKPAFDATQISNDIKVLDLKNLSVDEQVYVVNRMLEYTASGFIPKFVNKSTDINFKDWLKSEMERVVISS